MVGTYYIYLLIDKGFLVVLIQVCMEIFSIYIYLKIVFVFCCFKTQTKKESN